MGDWDIYEIDCDMTHKKPSLLEFVWIETKYYLEKAVQKILPD